MCGICRKAKKRTFMSLKHVLLVVLKKQKATGYGIAKWFDGPLGYFWNTSHQRVYRALAKLHEDGWVEFEVVPQQGKPDKKVYELTHRGEEELDKWMRAPLKPPEINEPFLVKLFSGEQNYVSSMADELEQQLVFHRKMLDEYRSVEQQFFADEANLSNEMQLMYLTLKRGLGYQQHCIDWSLHALNVLAQIKAKAG